MSVNTQTNTNKPTKKPLGGDMIMRFSKGERISHWVHGISFFLLLFTGFGIMSSFVEPAMVIFGGIQGARIVHRVVAVIFVVWVTLMFFIGDTKDHKYWVKAVFTWKKSDIQHVMAFPKEFFGWHGNYPAQDKFNGGEKINSMITMFGSVFITLSGFIMWFSTVFPVGLVRWAYPVHALAAVLMATAITGHMYLAVLHPFSNPALKGIINGYVKTSFAKDHYAKWYERVKDEQNLN